MQTRDLDQLMAAPRAAPARQRTAEGPLAPGHAAILRLQRLAGNESVNALLEEEPSPVRSVVGSGGGSPLDPGVRGFMEQRLGQDFAGVRVHTGGAADQSARSISAQAYTVGSDIVFRSGAYQPETPTGQRTIAHELAHVIQQRSGPVAGTPAPGGIRLSDPADPFEQAAEQTADGVMAQTLTAQRAEEEEEEQG